MKVLFFSTSALLDCSNGAALTTNGLMKELVKLGHQCAAVTGSIVDAPNDLFNRVFEVPHNESLKVPGTNRIVPVRTVVTDGVEHKIVVFRAGRDSEVVASEEYALSRLFLQKFESFQPDVLLTYGGFLSVSFAGLYAMSRGRKAVLYSTSGNEQTPDHFIHVSRIVTPSEAVRERLDRINGLPKIAIKPFIDTASVLCKTRSPDYITFINPVLEKGLKVAAALVVRCAQLGRPYKFLFVEARGTRETTLELCPELTDLPNLEFAENTADMRSVYERTGYLLMPSLWFEAAGMVCMESNANGIPVLAHRTGGIPEMLDGAGYLFDPPRALLENWRAPVPKEYVEQWVAVLDRLHNDPTEAKNAAQRAHDAAARYNPEALARKFVDFVAS